MQGERRSSERHGAARRSRRLARAAGWLLALAAALPATAGSAAAVALFPGDLLVGQFGSLLRVDPVTGDRTVVSSTSVGSGPAFGRILEILYDAQSGIFLADFDLKAIVHVDPATGDRTILASPTVGAGLPFRPHGVEVSALAGLLAIESDGPSLVSLSPLTGDRTVLSSSSVGSGPNFASPHVLRVGGPWSTVYVTDFAARALFEVNLGTGDRTHVTGPATGSGPQLDDPRGLAMVTGGGFYLVDSALDALIHVDPDTGGRTIVSDAATGSGPDFDFPYDVRSEADGGLVVVELLLNAVLRVDPATGDRSVVSDAGTGSGPDLLGPQAIAVVPTPRLAEGFEGYAPDAPPAGLPIAGGVWIESLGAEAPEGSQVLYLTTGPGTTGVGPTGIDVTGDGNVESDRAQAFITIERRPTDPALLAIDIRVLTDESPLPGVGRPDPVVVQVDNVAPPYLFSGSMHVANGSFAPLTGFAGGPLSGVDGSIFGQGQVGDTLYVPVDVGQHFLFLDVADELGGDGDSGLRVDNIRFLPEADAAVALLAGWALLVALRRGGRR